MNADAEGEGQTPITRMHFSRLPKPQNRALHHFSQRTGPKSLKTRMQSTTAGKDTKTMW